MNPSDRYELVGPPQDESPRYELVDPSQIKGATPSSVAPGLLDRLRAATQSALLSAATETAKSPTLSRVLQSTDVVTKPIISVTQAIQAPAIARGILQGAGSTATSVANLPIEAANLFGTNMHPLQMPDLSQYASPNESNLAALVGNVAGGSMIPLSAYSRIKNAIPAMKGLLKYAPSMAAGAGSGFLTGENVPGGRIGSAIVGGGISPLAEGLPSTIQSFRKAGSLEDDVKNSRQQLEDIVGGNSELESKKALVKVLSKAGKQTTDTFNKDYTDLKDDSIGQSMIKNPLNQNEVDSLDINSISGDARKKLNGLLTDKVGRETGLIDPTTGKALIQWVDSGEVHNVANYMDLSKQLRNEASDLRYKAKMGDYGILEKQKFLQQAKDIDKLKDSVLGKVYGSITTEEADKMATLDKNYADIALPFKLDPDIRKAVQNKEISAKSFFNATNQPNRERWQQYMQNAPWGDEYRSAITNHDLRNLDLRGLGPLTTTSRSDIMNSITPEARNAIAQHTDNLQAKADSKDMLAYINNLKKNVLPTLGAIFGLKEAGKTYHEISGGNE